MARGATVKAYDPTVTEPLDGVGFAADAYGACEGADVLVVLTEWDEFRWVDFDKVGGLMTGRNIVDARNLLDREALKRQGFTVAGIGRG